MGEEGGGEGPRTFTCFVTTLCLLMHPGLYVKCNPKVGRWTLGAVGLLWIPSLLCVLHRGFIDHYTGALLFDNEAIHLLPSFSVHSWMKDCGGGPRRSTWISFIIELRWMAHSPFGIWKTLEVEAHLVAMIDIIVEGLSCWDAFW